MLRNHMIGDPESTPSKDSVFRFDSTAQAEDPWYTNSGNDSPIESKGYNNNYGAYNNMNGSNFYEEDYENEPPLLEELGIRFDHIYSKTHAVMYPTQVRLQSLFHCCSPLDYRIEPTTVATV